MAPAELIPLAAAIPWCLLWVNLVVIPFFGKGEKLHQDYEEKGNLDAAFAAIESNAFIPTLARRFQRRNAQDDKRSRIEMESLLQAVDFLPDLERLEVALQSKRVIKDCYALRSSLASQLWKIGLFHSMFTILIPLSYLNSLPDQIWFDLTRILVILAWGLSLIWMVIAMFRFHRHMGKFVSTLAQSKEAPMS